RFISLYLLLIFPLSGLSFAQEIVTEFEKAHELYAAANQLEEAKNFDQAQALYLQVLKEYPLSEFAAGARLHYSRFNVLAQLADGNDVNSLAEIKNIEANFEKHPDFPWYLYGIANQYEELKKDNEANSIYGRILAQFPDSPVADDARLHFLRYKVLKLIADGNEVEAQTEIENIEVDFENHPDWPWYLYGIGNQYEEIEDDNEADLLYQQILAQYPDSPVAAGAKLHHSRYNVVSLLIADGNEANALAEMDIMAADFNGHPDLPWYLLIMPEECYKEGLNIGVKTPAGKRLMRLALKLLDRYMLGKVQDKESKTMAYYMAAITNYQLDEPEKTIEYSDKLLQLSPDFLFAANMQWLIADGYEKMKVLRHLPADQIDEVIEEEYQLLMDGYPDNPFSEFAAIKLGYINLKKDKQTKACAYFGWFLMNNSVGAEQFADIKKIVDRCGRYNYE
ncbi:MAG: tetratricopeptide repeat protein, partial [Phycisphaerae bacterium]|nr:tetratricopeptide repeat protein [Phycisphaerae bacterium]